MKTVRFTETVTRIKLVEVPDDVWEKNFVPDIALRCWDAVAEEGWDMEPSVIDWDVLDDFGGDDNNSDYVVMR